MRLRFDDLHLFIYLVVFDFVRAWMYVIIIIIIIIILLDHFQICPSFILSSSICVWNYFILMK